MKRNIEAIKRAEIKMSQMSGKAKEYYNNTQDGSWIEEYDGEFIIKYGNGEEEKYSNLKEMDEAFSALYDDVTVEIIADEIVEGNKAQAKMIVDMYNKLYGNEPVDILKDYENDYLTINTGSDGCEYAWYLYESKEKAVNLSTGKMIDKDEIEDYFFYEI